MNAPSPSQPISRNLALSIIQTALTVGETRFARRAALAWLTAYPGDLPMGLFHAQALLRDDDGRSNSNATQAVAILEGLIQTDPEYKEAHETLFLARGQAGLDTNEVTGSLSCLGSKLEAKSRGPKWGPIVQQARQAMSRGSLDLAEHLVHQALLDNPSTPLTAITHLQTEIRRSLPAPSIRSLAELYHQRWPECLYFSLILADALMDGGESDRAVALLHQVAASDVTAQVPTRLWGSSHPYRALWPERLEVPLLTELAIPAAVAAALGWNRLPAVSVVPQVELAPQIEPQAQPQAKPVAAAKPEEAETSQPEAKKPSASSAKRRLRFLMRHGEAGEAETGGDLAPGEGVEDVQPEGADDTLPEKETPNSKGNGLPESLRSVQGELEKIAASLKKPQLARADGRFPVYVIFTTRQGLRQQYGEQNAARIDQALQTLEQVVQNRKDWGSILFYGDDPSSFAARLPRSTTQIQPARPNDPWSLKLALADLDQALASQGEMIGAVLIVGGPEVVPFHKLPNPVDDADTDVPSDNPYATRDENYFIPEWPVGRLPGGAGSNPDFLLKYIRQVIERHSQAAKSLPWYLSLLYAFLNRMRPARPNAQPSLGYSAAVWKKASLSVFRPIGESRSMLISPPMQICASAANNPSSNGNGSRHDSGQASYCIPATSFIQLRTARLGYFNLHGLEDGAEWYGQRDPLEPIDGPDYPIALRPADITRNGNGNGNEPPQVVFSEACYGTHLNGRSVEDSLALTFLASGSLAVVGSTVTAYGSVAAPLAAADLIGFAFWSYLIEDFPIGEALRRAKIHLAREMHRRQGYLDGEDQKTLISFVLYGDPLAQVTGAVHKKNRSVRRYLKAPQVKTICDRFDEDEIDHELPPDMVTYVKHVVEQYLPGMTDAKLSFTQEHAGCSSEAHDCPTGQLGAKSRPASRPSRQVVMLSKSVRRDQVVHNHYARLTLDSDGKLVKLVVSR